MNLVNNNLLLKIHIIVYSDMFRIQAEAKNGVRMESEMICILLALMELIYGLVIESKNIFVNFCNSI